MRQSNGRAWPLLSGRTSRALRALGLTALVLTERRAWPDLPFVRSRHPPAAGHAANGAAQLLRLLTDFADRGLFVSAVFRAHVGLLL